MAKVKGETGKEGIWDTLVVSEPHGHGVARAIPASHRSNPRGHHNRCKIAQGPGHRRGQSPLRPIRRDPDLVQIPRPETSEKEQLRVERHKGYPLARGEGGAIERGSPNRPIRTAPDLCKNGKQRVRNANSKPTNRSAKLPRFIYSRNNPIHASQDSPEDDAVHHSKASETAYSQTAVHFPPFSPLSATYVSR